MNTERLLIDRNDSRLPAGEASGSPCHEGAFHLRNDGTPRKSTVWTGEKPIKVARVDCPDLT